jgi:TolB protein
MTRLRFNALAAALLAVAASFPVACRRAAPGGYRLIRLAADPQGGGDSALSPDGTRFLTTLRRAGNWDVWMFDIPSARWTQLTSGPADEFEARWSPDARTIVYTSTAGGNKDIYLMRLDQGRPLRLTDDAEDDEYPVFSPDGRSIVFTGGPWMQRRYFLVDTLGRHRRPVSAPAQAGACSFHPSGASLICHNYDSGTGNVYLYPVDGGDRLRLTEGGFWDYKPVISPDGKWVAYSRSQEGPSSIWMMPFPTGKAFPISGAGGDDRWPTFDARGSRLLFHRLVDRGRAIKTFDRRTRAVTTLTGAGDQPGAASLHRDGRLLAYTFATDRGERLRLLDLTNGLARELPTPGEAAFPRWSPDGGRLAFALKRGARWDVATFDLASGETRVWTHGEARGVRDPLDWSPDGKKIVFHGSTRPFEADLYLLDATSGELENLTADHAFSQAPAFTPDGSGVTFMSTRGGNWTWGFYELSLASRRFKLLLGPDYTEKNYPRLAPGGALIWSEFDVAGREYLATREASGEKELLRDAGAWARWPSLTADGSRIVFTEVEHTVEYWLAEGLDQAGSPLQTSTASVAARAGEPPVEPDPEAPGPAGPNRSPRRASPVQMHHR